MSDRKLTDEYIRNTFVPEALVGLTFSGQSDFFTLCEGDADFALELLKKTDAHCCIQLKKEKGDMYWRIVGKPFHEATQEEMDDHWKNKAAA